LFTTAGALKMAAIMPAIMVAPKVTAAQAIAVRFADFCGSPLPRGVPVVVLRRVHLTAGP
jgi:hypothetical protein